MWEEPFNLAGPLPHIEQVWFPGVHSDIGGGYEPAGLGRISLDWMMRKLASLGVSFDSPPSPQAPGQGLDPTATIHESRTLPLYAVDRFEPHLRPLLGIASADRSQRSRPQQLYKPIAEALHRSALDRWSRDGAYRPPNLEYVMRVVESGNLPVVDWDGSVMPPDRVAAAYPFVATTGPFAEFD
jgi:hypothetical protein